jgi:predicted DNA-binding antitoxin AbrB/MazE fold protein
MSITVEAIYQAGVLKPLEPTLSLKENTRVRLVIETQGVVARQRRERLHADPEIARDLIEHPAYRLLER